MREELSNIEIVLFALHKLGGISKKIHTEKIAWVSYQLDKERFSWQLPEFIERGFPVTGASVRLCLEKNFNMF
ncbi:MAG: hypothetical protein M3004_04165 [Bacteroidota bacterium]|nr:hypothetical protein [Bacteroidota bacterium]